MLNLISSAVKQQCTGQESCLIKNLHTVCLPCHHRLAGACAGSSTSMHRLMPCCHSWTRCALKEHPSFERLMHALSVHTARQKTSSWSGDQGNSELHSSILAMYLQDTCRTHHGAMISMLTHLEGRHGQQQRSERRGDVHESLPPPASYAAPPSVMLPEPELPGAGQRPAPALAGAVHEPRAASADFELLAAC